jgi:hypothetical protein
MNAITREELVRLTDRARRGEDLGKRQRRPNLLLEYHQLFERQRLRLHELLSKRCLKK